VAGRYRKLVLEPGGSANPNEYIESFLERPLSTEAFKTTLMAEQPED
jgi:thimet oligopeptidase